MLRTMAAAYEIAAAEGHGAAPLRAALASHRRLGQRRCAVGDRIGRLAPGYEADLVSCSTWPPTRAIAQATARADDIWQAVFPTPS